MLLDGAAAIASRSGCRVDRGVNGEIGLTNDLLRAAGIGSNGVGNAVQAVERVGRAAIDERRAAQGLRRVVEVADHRRAVELVGRVAR